MNAFVKIIIASMLFAGTLRAQVVLPLGLGQKSATELSCSYNDQLYVLNQESNTFILNKWDGSFWIPYARIPSSVLNDVSADFSQIVPVSMTVFKGNVFLVLSDKTSGKLTITYSSGNNWNRINTDKLTLLDKAEFIDQDGRLLLCGKLKIDALQVSMIEISNGGFSIFAYSPSFQGAGDYYSDFEWCGGKIWAIGLFSSPLDPNKRYFSYFENNVWKIVDNPPGLFGFEGMGKYRERLILVTRNSDNKLSFVSQSSNQNIWDAITNGLDDWEIQSVSDLKQIGNHLWVSGNFYNNTLNRRASLAFWDGYIWKFPDVDYLSSDVRLNGQKQVFVHGTFLQHQGLLLNKTGVVDLGTALIAGKVFRDLNQNCTQDHGENPIQGILIKLSPENIYTVSDYNGCYYFPVDSQIDVHAVEVIVPKHHVATCERLIGTRHQQNLTIAGIDFGIMPSGQHTDAAVHLSDYTGWRARQGFEEQYRLCVTNKGTRAIETGRLVLQHDARLVNWNYSETPDMINGGSMEWLPGKISAGEHYCIDLQVTVPVGIPLNEKIQFDAKIFTTDVQDEDLTDNQSLLQQAVVAAIDPNDKKTRQDFFITPFTPSLDYKIRFQNTGTDTAYNIVVTDTIDQNLYLDTRFVNPVSHEEQVDFSARYWITQDGKYRYKFAWKFTNILLPDSNTNEKASHGFIDYNLLLTKELKAGTLVKNKAYIYFDYQEPIITNTALNVISVNTGIDAFSHQGRLNYHPNPAHESLSITNPYLKNIEVTLINSLGQVVHTFEVPAQSRYVHPTHDMVKGLYFIKVDGFATERLLVH